MKIKHKKIYVLASLFTLVFLTSAPTIKDTQASLTAPTNYDISFNGITYTSANGASPTSVALFERTADGVYYNYYHRFRDTRLNPNHTNPAGSGMHSNASNYDLPTGLDITMEFKRSNTDWTIATPYNGYYNTDTKIGSNNTVGTITNKIYLQFDNQTNKDYLIYYDQSSGTSADYYVKLNSNTLYSWNSDKMVFQVGDFIRLYIPAFSTLELYAPSTDLTFYFDAWYLKDLGVSAAYTAGINDNTAYDLGFAAGFDSINAPNTLLMGFQAMVGILVNFVLMIVNLEVFGISILNVFSILVLFVGVIWILKIVRG